MSSGNAIRVAVLGAGNMGENVIRHLADNPLLRNITVFDRHPERMEILKQRHGVETSQRVLNKVLERSAYQIGIRYGFQRRSQGSDHCRAGSGKSGDV